MGTTPELIFKKLGLNKPSLIEDKKTKYIQEVEETRFFLNEKSIEKINTYFGDIRIAIYARLTFISKSIFARFDSITNTSMLSEINSSSPSHFQISEIESNLSQAIISLDKQISQIGNGLVAAQGTINENKTLIDAELQNLRKNNFSNPNYVVVIENAILVELERHFARYNIIEDEYLRMQKTQNQLEQLLTLLKATNKEDIYKNNYLKDLKKYETFSINLSQEFEWHHTKFKQKVNLIKKLKLQIQQIPQENKNDSKYAPPLNIINKEYLKALDEFSEIDNQFKEYLSNLDDFSTMAFNYSEALAERGAPQFLHQYMVMLQENINEKINLCGEHTITIEELKEDLQAIKNDLSKILSSNNNNNNNGKEGEEEEEEELNQPFKYFKPGSNQ